MNGDGDISVQNSANNIAPGTSTNESILTQTRSPGKKKMSRMNTPARQLVALQSQSIEYSDQLLLLQHQLTHYDRVNGLPKHTETIHHMLAQLARCDLFTDQSFVGHIEQLQEESQEPLLHQQQQ